MKLLKEKGAASLCYTGLIRLDDYGIKVGGSDLTAALLAALLGPREEGYRSLAFAGTVHLTIERQEGPVVIHNGLTEERGCSSETL